MVDCGAIAHLAQLILNPDAKLKVRIQVDWSFSFTSVIGQKDEFHNGCFKKTEHAKFSEKRTFLTITCAYQGVRNVRFSENLTWFVFLKHPL